LLIDQEFSDPIVVCGRRNAECGWIGPRSRIILARQRRSSARQADLSCRFRSIWVWIAVTRTMAAFVIGKSQGQVLRCHLSDDEDGNLVVYVDDKELDADAFLSLIRPFAGWGMRLTFMDESQVYDEPSVIIRDPDKDK
jgi:hypothetical protein